jgi:hypothetical protein
MMACITSCPMRAQCAGLAVDLGADSGVWAGIDLGDNGTRPDVADKIEQLRKIAKGVTA